MVNFRCSTREHPLTAPKSPLPRFRNRGRNNRGTTSIQTFLTKCPSRCANTHQALSRAHPSVPTGIAAALRSVVTWPLDYCDIMFGKRLRRVFDYDLSIVNPLACKGKHRTCVLTPTGRSLKGCLKCLYLSPSQPYLYSAKVIGFCITSIISDEIRKCKHYFRKCQFFRGTGSYLFTVSRCLHCTV